MPGARASDLAMIPASAPPLCTNWAACATFSPRTIAPACRGQTPALRSAASAAWPYGACRGLAIAIFGAPASASVRGALEDAGVRHYVSSHAAPSRPGRLHLSPGNRRLAVDRIVTVPRLGGPRVQGVASDPGGFIRADAYGRVLGTQDVFAAGDATAFAIKQGGLAAQQGDVVAAAIAASVGVDIAPRPFRPVLRGLLMAGGTARYMRARIAIGAGDDCAVSERPLWWPPNRLCGRYLAPYLSSRVGGGSVMFGYGAGPRDLVTSGGPRALAELDDLSLG